MSTAIATEAPALHKRADGALVGADGWVVRLVSPEMLEYSDGDASCIINVGRAAGHGAEATRRIYASESSSDHFPQLHQHLQAALPHLNGRFELV